MKQGFLTTLFILYQFFTPFIFVDCGGEDIPYDRTTQADEDEEVSPDESDDCDQNEFLTADCVEEVQAGQGEEPPADPSTP